MNARERRTIRIGVAIGTLVGLIGCGAQRSNRQAVGRAPAVSSPGSTPAVADFDARVQQHRLAGLTGGG